MILTLGLCLCGHAAEEPNPIGDDWRRQPELRLPLLPKAPTIDGRVDRAEWLYAAELGPLKAGRAGVADELPRRVWVGYDATTMYMAIQLYRPSGAIEPESPNQGGRIDRTGKGDCIEIQFAPDLVFDKGFAFWFYANGAFGEATTDRDKNKNWNTDWQVKTSQTEFGWEAEVAIPFAAFGLDGPPAADTVWGFDVVDNRLTPFKMLAHWSYRGNLWHGYEYFGRIRFDSVPAVRFESAGDVGGGKMAVMFSVANGTGAAATVDVDLQLLKRKAGADGGLKSYYENIDSGMTHDADADYYKGTSLEREIESALRTYEPLADGEHKQSLEIPDGERRAAGRSWPIAYGEYLAVYTVRQGDVNLSRGVASFIVEPPLALMLEPYWLYSELIDVSADLKKVKIPGPCTAIITLHDDDLSTVLAQDEVPVKPGDLVATGTVSTADRAPGFYRVQVRIVDAAGKEVASNVEPIERPATPPWYKNNYGNQVLVPPPWTPVVATADGRTDIWARSHDFSTFFPRSILVRGKELLARPVNVELMVGGKLVEWTVAEFAMESAAENKVVYRATLDSPVATLAGTVTVEFDGFAWYELVLTPKTTPLQVDSMQVAMDIRPEYAELQSSHKFLNDRIMNPGGPKPAKGSGSGTLDHSQIPFTPSVWIGNEAAGITFIAESPMDWIVTKPNEVLEILPATATQAAGIRAHVIDAPSELGKPMRLQFALQATPIREFSDHSMLNIFQKSGVFGHTGTYKQLRERGCREVVFYYSWRGNNQTEMGGTPERPPSEEQQKLLKSSIKQAHAADMKVIMFTGWGVNASSPNWKQFGFELGRMPIHNQGWGTYGQSAGLNGGYADFMAWGHHDIATEYGADGALWDSTSNLTQCSNLRIGNGWLDDQGRLRPGFAVRATREVYRRVYTIYKSEAGAKQGVIYNHAGSMWCINAFADIINRGEGSPMHAKTILAGWGGNLDFFRSNYSGEPFGLLFSGDNNDFAELPMRVSTHLALYLLHGNYHKEYSYHAVKKRNFSYDYNDRPLVALWEIFDWFGWDQDTRKFYYYQDQTAVTQEPANLLSSAFVSGDNKRALVCVSNLQTEPVKDAKVRIDLKALGMAAGTVTMSDAYLKKQVFTPDAEGLITLDIDQQRYRLIQIEVTDAAAE